MVKEVGARRSTLARTLQQVGSRAKAHNQKTVKQHLVEYADSHVEGAQMLWWLVEQKWVDYLLDIQKGGGQEKPLAQSQNKFDALPIYVYESILKESPHVPGYFKSASNMKKLRVKDRCIHKKLVQMASAVPRDFPIAAGTTPSEAVDLLCSRIAAVGDRLNGMTISENGIVDWASSSPWKWHVSANGGHIVVEHKFIQAQVSLPYKAGRDYSVECPWSEVDCILFDGKSQRTNLYSEFDEEHFNYVQKQLDQSIPSSSGQTSVCSAHTSAESPSDCQASKKHKKNPLDVIVSAIQNEMAETNSFGCQVTGAGLDGKDLGPDGDNLSNASNKYQTPVKEKKPQPTIKIDELEE